MSNSKPAKDGDRREEIALKHIRAAVRGVRYGTVTILVQDGVVIQVDRTEKIRLDYSKDDLNLDGSGI
jgi:hypothetical protein